MTKYEELKNQLKEAVILQEKLYDTWSKAIDLVHHIPDGTKYGDLNKEDQELIMNRAMAHGAWSDQLKATEKLRANIKRHFTITQKKLARMKAELEAVDEEVWAMKNECGYHGDFSTSHIERDFEREYAETNLA